MDFLSDILQTLWLGKPAWAWLGFLLAVGLLMALDLGVLHRAGRAPAIRESMMMCGFYTTLGIGFAGVIYWLYGPSMPATLQDMLLDTNAEGRGWHAAQLYLTGYFVELSLSMDNVFVISLIFRYFAVPQQHQHRVLFWGIIGVILFRAVLIGLGAALVSQFHWVLYVFGAFLIYAGAKMLLAKVGHEPDIAQNPILKFMRRHFPITHDLHGEKFFIRQRDPKHNKVITYMTPLFLALVMVEFADVIFAVDSVPAIFAITPDPFLVYTSNIFAIIGLRALYFTLAVMVHRFEYLKNALALILILIGMKILVTEILHIDLPDWVSLAATLLLLIGGVVYSLEKTRRAARNAAR